jgi:hypothetical protein
VSGFLTAVAFAKAVSRTSDDDRDEYGSGQTLHLFSLLGHFKGYWANYLEVAAMHARADYSGLP